MVKTVYQVVRLFTVLVLIYVTKVGAESFNGFDLSNSLISKKDIVQGGPPRDGIPAISNPSYVSAADASFLKSEDIVLGIEINGAAFAYPRHIMNWHELVNDEFKGGAFLISYCPLCGSGMAFSSNVAEQRLTFGVSGLLYNNDLIFYDQQTDSLWSQIERRAISGEFAGQKLQQLYLEHTSWQDWLSKHPDTRVLSEQQGFKRNYRHDPYTGYDTSSQVFFKTLREAPDDFHSKEKVLGLQINGHAKAYPFSELKKHEQASFDDELGGVPYRVFWNEEAGSATVKALTDQEVLTPTVAFWFAWYNFHPKTEIFRALP